MQSIYCSSRSAGKLPKAGCLAPHRCLKMSWSLGPLRQRQSNTSARIFAFLADDLDAIIKAHSFAPGGVERFTATWRGPGEKVWLRAAILEISGYSPSTRGLIVIVQLELINLMVFPARAGVDRTSTPM